MSEPGIRSIMEPPFCYGSSNYPEWKVKMEYYIKAIFGMDAWISSILTGWKPPTVEDETRLIKINKPHSLWTDSDYEICGYNSKVLNAIFCSVGDQLFKRISTCETAKDAWDILQASYEKSGELRAEELSILTKRFNDLCMGENEPVSYFHEKLVDIAYEANTLGKPYSDQQLVRKLLLSLPARFKPTVAALILNPCAVKLEDLIHKLKACELRLQSYKNSSRFYL